jgi:hypothetical protein
MNYAVRGLGLAASLALVSSAAVVTHANAQSSSPPAAYVYVQIQGSAGAVYGFSASSTGQLTAISGAPWKPAGLIIGSNTSQFFTLGKDQIHSYAMASDGAIGSEISEISFYEWAGAGCGVDGGYAESELNPAGNSMYVLLQNGGDNHCAAYQVYNISSEGVFSFGGDWDQSISGGESADLPSIQGSGTFGYADLIDGHSSSQIGFGGAGTPQGGMQFTETNPTLSGGSYMPYRPDASPTRSFLVMQLFPNESEPPQLGVYTVGAHGSIWTTNTSSNMPTSPFNNISTTFSPSGEIFAAYADNGSGPGGNGIQLYKFNGGSPLIPYKTLLNGTPIDQVLWDNSNHLYAISKSENKLYVFTVTTTSVVQNTAWSIGSPFQMVVVSNGSAGSATTQYQSSLLTTSGTLAVDGNVNIDTEGNTTVYVNGAVANTSYAVTFCPAFVGGNSNPPACFKVTTVSTDSGGNGSSKVKFPKTGNWAGDFTASDTGGGSVLQTGLFPNVSSEFYMSTFLPESTTDGDIAINNGQNPLSSGSVTYSAGTLVFTVNGAAPSTNYQIDETEGTAVFNSSTYAIGGFTTNSSGDASTSISLASTGSDYGDTFQIEGGSGAGFIGGFSIP